MKELIMTLLWSVMLVVMALFIYDKYVKTPDMEVVTIDIQKVLHEKEERFKKELRSSADPIAMGEVYNRHMAYLDMVGESIDEYGRKHGLLILDKRAVLSGERRDLTDELAKALIGR